MRFLRRHGIESVALHGQAAISTVEEAAEDMAKLRERLREIDVSTNADGSEKLLMAIIGTTKIRGASLSGVH